MCHIISVPQPAATGKPFIPPTISVKGPSGMKLTPSLSNRGSEYLQQGPEGLPSGLFALFDK